MNLEAMQEIDIRTVDADMLVDIRSVSVNTDLPYEERVIDFIRQIKNPYLYKYEQMVIKTSFADTDATLEDRLESYFLSLC